MLYQLTLHLCWIAPSPGCPFMLPFCRTKYCISEIMRTMTALTFKIVLFIININFRTTPIYSCMGIFSFGGRMNITLKIKNNMNGMESWSEPYEVAVQEASNNPLITHFSTSFETFQVLFISIINRCLVESWIHKCIYNWFIHLWNLFKKYIYIY